MDEKTFIVIGKVEGLYENDEIKKEFSCFGLVMIRPDRSVVVQNLSNGIRPICYIGEGANVKPEGYMNTDGFSITATTDDGQRLTLNFFEEYQILGASIKHG